MKVDFSSLLSQKDIILEHLALFILVFLLGCLATSLFYKNKIDTNEERLKYKDELLKERNQKIQDLEQKLISQEGFVQETDAYNLSIIRIETFREELKHKKNKIKSDSLKIQRLEKQIKAQNLIIKSKEQIIAYRAAKQNAPNASLNYDEIKALMTILKFENNNPIQSPRHPPEYSVDDLARDLEIGWHKANGILKKLRELGLFESVYDNIALFPNSNRPINEVRPGRLSDTGRNYFQNLRCAS